MKFSDMMGKGDRRHDTEVAEPELPTEARTAPPVPEAPIRFGGGSIDPSGASDTIGTESTPPSPLVPPDVPPPAGVIAAPPLAAPAAPAAPATPAAPSISEVVAELAPRPASAAIVTDQQLDASAWLDGINTIDDDLLPH